MAHKSLVRYLTNSVVDELTQRKFPFQDTNPVLQKHMQSTAWENGILSLFPRTTPLSCDQILKLALPLMEEVCPTPPTEGWLKFSYRYIQSVMFPDSPCFTENITQFQWGAVCYLSILQVFFNYEADVTPFHPFVRFRLLSPQEWQSCDNGEEYARFLACYKQEFIYELMRLGAETTPFQTLGHIGGVHHVAMTVANGLKQSGSLIDLALVSASALSHDFGKFGCRPGERVPYLHYYYTDQWLTERGLHTIAHIAANHSTWDLELEALSAESLCLIYADFRSKQERGPNGEEITILFPLKEAFDVILDKLDNVDPAKKRRYQLVYSRLKDFEDYLAQIGADLKLEGAPLSPAPKVSPSLMSADQTITALSLLSVEHSLHLMHLLSSKDKFGHIIESARSVQNNRELHAFLTIFRNYFTYLSVEQKTQTLAFLYDLLVHRDGDIRRQSGALMGQIIAKFHLVYRKELPDHVQDVPADEAPFALWHQYLAQIILPDHKTTPRQRSQIGYTLKLFIDAMLMHSRAEDIPRFVGELLAYYNHPEELEYTTAFTLIEAIRSLPPQHYNEYTRDSLISFCAYFRTSDSVRLHTSVLQFFIEAQRSLPSSHPQMTRIVQATHDIPDTSAPVIYLKYKVLKRANQPVDHYAKILNNKTVTSDIFLDNLKAATPWAVKVAGVNLLQEQGETGDPGSLLHIVTHFSNLLKTSERVVVRLQAGEAFVRLIPRLTRDERNEVVVELGKGLEMGQLELTNYIPQYLGEAALFLSPNELDEQIIWLQSLLSSQNQTDCAGAVNTACVMLEYYPNYQNRFPQQSEAFEARRRRLLGILLQGLAHYSESVQEVSLLALTNLFESRTLHPTEVLELFSLCYRKLLFLIGEGKHTHGPLTFFFRASALNAINHFISLYQLDFNQFTFKNPRRIAFFPGTFDPFTLSHKGIVESICDLGFDVFLAIDEFSWSKKSQPHLIRRQIVNLSIADMFHVHLFPFDIPVNIANPSDLHRLQQLFPEQEVYLVVGSDVVSNASSYQKPPEAHSVHNLNHIIFHRAGATALTDEEKSRLKKDVVLLNLPSHLEDISSTRIRENVDHNRDISSLIQPVVQDYIYQNGLYLRDFQNKQLIASPNLYFSWITTPTTAHLSACETVFEQPIQANFSEGEHLITLQDANQQTLAYLTYRYVASEELLSMIPDVNLVNRLRLRARGKMIFITGGDAAVGDRDYLQIIFTELLVDACGKQCVYGVFHPHDEAQLTQTMEDTLLRQGFLRYEGGLGLLEVTMSSPSVLIQNLETTIQEPLCHNPNVKAAINQGHLRLQSALTKITPGHLLLTLHAEIIHQRLMEKITAYNNVPLEPQTPRKLGEYMCVPFGKMLRGKIVPNTVTKTIHTDKVYTPDLNTHSVQAFLNYPPITCQVRTIKSFDRPVILVDDMMHTGFRIGALDPILHDEQINLATILVGLLSGHGRDLISLRNRPVDCIYFIPTLKHWFIESTAYPFFGGDTVSRERKPLAGMLSGINHVMPYESPAFLANCTPTTAAEFSRSCLVSTRQIIGVLEQEYRTLYSRNLTLSRLAEAIILPLCPDKGDCFTYDGTLAPSTYLDNDIELLERILPKY